VGGGGESEGRATAGLAVTSNGGGEIRALVKDSDQSSGHRGRERAEMDHLLLRVQQSLDPALSFRPI